MLKVDASTLIEENVGSAADNLILFSTLTHLVIIKLIPITFIQSICSVMSSRELSLVIRDSKQVIEWSIGRHLTRDYELGHIQAIDWEIDQGILLGVITTESLQVDYQDRRHVVDLDLLDSLLVVNTAITVPCISLGELFWSVELSEAVIDAYTFRKLFTWISLSGSLEL